MNFSDRLKAAAGNAGVKDTLSDMARSLGLARQTVHPWTKGVGRMPSTEYIFLIAKKWGVDPHWLSTGEGSMTHHKSRAPDSLRKLLAAYDECDEADRALFKKLIR